MPSHGPNCESTLDSGSWSPAYRAIETLVDRVGSGQVVFFVGAGFSLDSENNSAPRLMRRLLWRLQALTLELKDAVDRMLEDAKSVVSSRDTLRDGKLVLDSIPDSLRRTFGLPNFDADNWTTKQDVLWWSNDEVGKLAGKYYESNDWFCATFEKLLEIGYAVAFAAGAKPARKAERLTALIEAVSAREARILRPDDDHPAEWQAVDSVPLCPITACLFHRAHSRHTNRLHSEDRRRDAGKTLFLDTMGFADEAIMGGSPAIRNAGEGRSFSGWFRDERQRVENSYRGKLFSRHHVLARLAREGLCPVVLTTNYDLLLEGAWRLSGFEAEEPASQGNRSLFNPALPSTPLKQMAVVASPVDFVEKGKANRTSLVVKVHGCVDEYRDRRAACAKITAEQVFDSKLTSELRRNIDRWEAYLQQMVFTYREIQNWREDSWARDYLATLQRTRTVAFVGYSLQDPVIHDAFRTVYEDMAGHREREPDHGNSGGSHSGEPNPDIAPAFFLGHAQQQSFHATEVLHAATHAAGGKVAAPHDHSNYLRFWYLNEEQFPNLDDLFLWTYHRAIRERQRRMLRDDLRSAAATVLHRGGSHSGFWPLPSDIERIEDRFQQVIQAEVDLVAEWFGHKVVEPNAEESASEVRQADAADHQRRRRQLHRIARWTWNFHPALWKEFACSDTQTRRGASVHAIDALRKANWYQPAISSPGRVAWAVAVELALRWRLGNIANLEAGECLEPRDELVPLDLPVPALHFYRKKRPFGDVTERKPGSRFQGLNRAAIPDGLILTCESPGRVMTDLHDVTVGIWHEWHLPTDGRVWGTRGATGRKSNDLFPGDRGGNGKPGRRRGIVNDVPAAIDIWHWAQGREQKSDIRRFDSGE